MRYLITGGAGFIGSHLADRLLARGDTIVALDDLSTGSARNIAHLESEPRFTFVHGTILDHPQVAAMVDQCDVVVHLAAAVGVRLIVERPLESLITNIRGTEIVLDAAAQAGTKILITSTSEIYGKNVSAPLHEDADRILGSPFNAWRTNRGSTIPNSPVWRGPTQLNRRTTIDGRPRSRQNARARISSTALAGL